MFYDNLIDVNSIKYKNKSLGGFKGVNSDIDRNVLSMDYSPISYNFDYSNGVLVDGIGVHELMFRSNNDRLYYKMLDKLSGGVMILGIWLFNMWAFDLNGYRPIILVYTSTGDFYYNRLYTDVTELTKIDGLNFQEKPIVASYKFEGEDTLILVSEKDGMYIWRFPYLLKKIENAPSISSMCVHNDRLFVTTHGEKRTIYFSDDLNPTNFNISSHEGGFINILDEFGRSNKILSFEGYLYVIRDFNIAKVVAYDDPEDFSVSQLYVSNSKIYENTVCVCGSQIYYLASDGIYSFDGSRSKRLDFNINKFLEGVDNSNAVAGYSKGYYYLACTLNFGDVYKGDDLGAEELFSNNALIKINASTGDIVIMRGYNIKDLFVINHTLESEICVLIEDSGGARKIGVLDMSGKYFDKDIVKLWSTANTDFDNPNKNKIIKSITLETYKDIVLELITDKGTKIIEVTGKKGYQSIRLNIKTKNLSVNFISKTSGNYIANPQVMVGFYE